MIQSGIEPPTFFSREEARRALLEHIGTPIPKHMFWIGTVAEIHPNKGLSYAILAMQTIPNALYIIIGDGEERNRLKNLVRAKGLAERVFFAGHMDNAARFLLAFDIFLFPSITEALGYALLEAGFARLPSVATNVGGIPEIIKDGKQESLYPKNPRDSRRGLLLMQDKKSAEYGTRSFSDVKIRFSIGTNDKNTERLYQK